VLSRFVRTAGMSQSPESTQKGQGGLVYECVRCGAMVYTDELELRGGGVKCTYCGFRVLKKIRPPVVKRVKAK